MLLVIVDVTELVCVGTNVGVGVGGGVIEWLHEPEADGSCVSLGPLGDEERVGVTEGESDTEIIPVSENVIVSMPVTDLVILDGFDRLNPRRSRDPVFV